MQDHQHNNVSLDQSSQLIDLCDEESWLNYIQGDQRLTEFIEYFDNLQNQFL